MKNEICAMNQGTTFAQSYDERYLRQVKITRYAPSYKTRYLHQVTRNDLCLKAQDLRQVMKIVICRNTKEGVCAKAKTLDLKSISQDSRQCTRIASRKVQDLRHVVDTRFAPCYKKRHFQVTKSDIIVKLQETTFASLKCDMWNKKKS